MTILRPITTGPPTAMGTRCKPNFIVITTLFFTMGLWSDFIAWWMKKIQATQLTLSAPKKGTVGQTLAITGQLVRKSNMTAIANANVTVTVTPPTGSPTTVIKVTDSTGKFTVSLPLTLVGNYVVKCDYAGAPNQYSPSSAQTTIEAKPAPVPTTLTLVPSATSGTVGDTITINVTLTT